MLRSKCQQCGEDFAHTSRQAKYCSHRCKMKQYNKRKYIRYKTSPGYKQHIDAQSREWRHKHYGNWLVLLARRRAKRKGLEFSLRKGEVIVPPVCPVLGIPLEPRDGVIPSDNSPTLDRINNSKGYTSDNVCVISHRANRIKADATLSELRQVVSYLESNGG
jgi:hypothetical protein